MFIFKNFIGGIAEILDTVLNLYMWAFIISALLSWVNPDPYNPIVRFLYQITEPALRPIRRIIPFSNIGIDFSPMIAILLISFLRKFLVGSLVDLAFRMNMGGG